MIDNKVYVDQYGNESVCVSLVEYLCGADMDYLDYKRVNNDFDLKDLAAYTEEEEHIVEWLKKYNLLINEEDITLELVRKYLLVTDGPVNKDMLDYFFIDQKVREVLRRKLNLLKHTTPN